MTAAFWMVLPPITLGVIAPSFCMAGYVVDPRLTIQAVRIKKLRLFHKKSHALFLLFKFMTIINL
jgi:hypothetical protein